MRNIYSITPNPALDLSGHVSKILPNEKNYVSRMRKDPGGNGINAARIIHRLGGKAIVFGFLGGSAGGEVEQLLIREGVKTKFTRIAESTRTNVTVTNDADHLQTRLTFPGPEISRSEIKDLIQKVKNISKPGILLVGGSLPEGCPKDFHSTLGRIGAENGCEVVVDLPSQFLKKFLRKNRPLLVKPNLLELEMLAGKKLASQKEILEQALVLAQVSKLVCVSLGSKGAILATEKQAYFGFAPKIKARGTVGAGDSMVGAMVFRLATLLSHINEKESLMDILAWGIAAGSATAESEGTAMASAIRIQSLMKKVTIRTLFESS